MNGTIWIDILNPSHPLFFKPIIDRLSDQNRILVTLRDRGETLSIAKDLGISGEQVGRDYEGPIRKTGSIIFRTMNLALNLDRFDIALSFENPMSIAVGHIRRKKTVLMLDNDIKYSPDSGTIQKVESWLKTRTKVLIVPNCAKDRFEEHFKNSNVFTYGGYKEDIYIADHRPDSGILREIPFEDYIVIRPEAFASFYVKHEKSILPSLLDRFNEEGKNVVLLPRDRSDWKISRKDNVHIPAKPLNGLDLIHYSSGVLTGSGTMAREGALMGKKSVSFFPGEELLAVDQDLIKKGMMVHSRDVEEIVDHILSKKNTSRSSHDPNLVQQEFMNILRSVIQG